MNPSESGQSAATTPQPEARPPYFDLYLREDFAPGFVFTWKLKDSGVTLDKDGLRWRHDGAERHALYADIRSIRLQTGHIPRSGTFATCLIAFRNGRNILVTTFNAWGVADGERNDRYGDFLRELHKRLTPEHRKQIAFNAGDTSIRHNIGWVVAIFATAFFVVLPIGLLLYTGESKVLFVTLSGFFFVYPVWQTLKRNEPRAYHPDYLDDDVFP